MTIEKTYPTLIVPLTTASAKPLNPSYFEFGDIQTDYKTVSNRVFSDHRIHALLERSLDAAKKLENIYEDEDGLRKEEVSKIGGPNEFKEFYERKWFQKIAKKKSKKFQK